MTNFLLYEIQICSIGVLKLKEKKIKSGKFLSFIDPFMQGWKAVFIPTKLDKKALLPKKHGYEDEQKHKEKKKEKPMAIPM